MTISIKYAKVVHMSAENLHPSGLNSQPLQHLRDYDSIEELRPALDAAGVVVTDSLFNLADKSAIDVKLGNLRYLVYPRTPEDDSAYLELAAAGIPEFPRSMDSAPALVMAEIPTGSRPITGILGGVDFGSGSIRGTSFESIVYLSGQLLNHIEKLGKGVPDNFSLSRLAFVKTEPNNPIRLIPPVKLVEEDVHKVIARISRELYNLEPDKPHARQLDAFLRGYQLEPEE